MLLVFSVWVTEVTSYLTSHEQPALLADNQLTISTYPRDRNFSVSRASVAAAGLLLLPRYSNRTAFIFIRHTEG